jgi:hypothetical protein
MNQDVFRALIPSGFPRKELKAALEEDQRMIDSMLEEAKASS